MKKSMLLFACIITALSFFSCETKPEENSEQVVEYIPEDIKLLNEIIAKDKEYFDAYNNCDIEKQASMYSDDIEFYHDKGGLMTSKEELLQAIKDNICGKVTRTLIKGSIEVYPINNYGAVQIGFHKFHNNQEPDAKSNPSKFITIWKNDNEEWKMERVISLH